MTSTSIQSVYRHLRQIAARPGDAPPDPQLLRQFIDTREESAFAALVERHAGMVFGVCRSILRNRHDAEDVFQAVFLVLARKAATIRKGQAVGSWLYAVAARLAWKARARADKRRTQPLPEGIASEAAPMDDVTWGELRGILHEEVGRLPEKYRAAVVLCYWQGQTHEQAGRQLGCAGSTVKDRLERARELLGKRLARRGLALSAAWFAGSLSGGTSSAAVPVELLYSTMRGAMLFSLGELPAGLVSAQAVAYARRTVQAMLLSKLKYGLVLVLTIGVFSGGAGLAALRESPMPAVPEAAEEQPNATAAPKKERENVDRHNDPLPPGAVARLGTLRFRHGDLVQDMAIGSDGKSIVSAAGKIVYVWDLATGKERRRFEGHENTVTSVACSPDGKLIASGCRDGSIRIWDAKTGQESRRFIAHKGRDPTWKSPGGAWVRQFTPDGRQLISTGADLAIRLWDVSKGTLVRKFGGRLGLIDLALSPDGKTLAGFVGDDKAGEIKLWEVATGGELGRFALPSGRATSIDFSPDGKTLAVSAGESDWKKPSEIHLWDIGSAKEIRFLRGHQGWAGCLTFSPDGKTLASTSTVDVTARLWDVSTGAELRHIGPDRRLPIRKLLYLSDGKTLVSQAQENTLRFWDSATGSEVRPPEEATRPVSCIRFSPGGRWLAGASEDGVIRLWDAATREEVRRFQHGILPVAVSFSPDARFLASASLLDPAVRIWETASGKESRRIKAVKDASFFICMAWSSDGKVLATRSHTDRLVHLWDAAGGKELRQLPSGDVEINSLAFSPDGKVLAAAGGVFGRGNKLVLWATDTGRLLHSLAAPPDLHDFHCVVFSPDGRTLAAGGRYGGPSSIYLWEVASGRQRLTLKHGEDVTALAFSPDGRLLAAADNKTGSHISANGRSGIQDFSTPEQLRVRLWDVGAEKELPPLEGHKGAITALSFSPNGKLLASASNDTTVLLWDATRLRKARPLAAKPLGRERIEALWADLGGDDAAKAYRAIRTLAASPRESVDYLKRHLQPIVPADSKRVAPLLADLDGENFTTREKAMQELEKLGESAATELHHALAGKPSLEMKRRIEQLLEKATGTEQVRQVRAVEVLELIGTPEARALCAMLADGVVEARLTREARATLRRLRR